MKLNDYFKLERWGEDLSHVFTLKDLKILFSSSCTEAALFKKIERAIKDKVLIKIKRGMYATPDASLANISARIAPESYLSTGSILAEHLVIGSIPEKRVQAIKLGPSRIYKTELGTIEHLGIDKRYFFGFEEKQGIKKAEPEKAFLDACYFAWKGKSFSFDISSDIARERLQKSLLLEYVSRYDRRFQSFFYRVAGW